jgi:hypothetical protein
VTVYKFLRADGASVFTGFRWPLPAGDGPGEWVTAAIDPCRAGIHACRVGDLPYWAGRVLYEAEVAGPVAEQQTKVVAARGRLVRRVDAWDDAFRDEYTRYCADRATTLAREGGLDGWDAVIEPSVPEGPALLSFVAARIAEEIEGRPGYHDERARHARWLADRLGLAA